MFELECLWVWAESEHFGVLPQNNTELLFDCWVKKIFYVARYFFGGIVVAPENLFVIPDIPLSKHTRGANE